MANQTERDFQLAEVSATVMDAVAGNAMATIVVLQKKPAERERQKRQVEVAQEIAARFTDRTYALLPFTLEYTPDMPEAALRLWAAALVEAMRS